MKKYKLITIFFSFYLKQQQEQQLSCNSHGYLQGNLPNIQSDQQCLSDQSMLDIFQEPNVSTMVNRIVYFLFFFPRPSIIFNYLYIYTHTHTYTLTITFALILPKQQQQLLCNPHGYLQETLPNGQLDHNIMNSFQEPNVSTMVNIT